EALDRFNGMRIALRRDTIAYTLDVRAYDDGVAFRWTIPGRGMRTPDESSLFVLPAGSTVWYHDLRGHYEGSYVKRAITDVPTDDWAGPPLTVKLPGGGYAAVTEAALSNYSGMALQADGARGFQVRLGHEHPPSYPFTLRYG